MDDNSPETERAEDVPCPTSTQKPVDQGFSYKIIGPEDSDELKQLLKTDDEWIERHRDPSRPDQASAEELELLMEEPPLSLLNAYAEFFDNHLPSGHPAVHQFFRDEQMLSRMWNNAMAPVLESFRKDLPASREPMRKFVETARDLAILLHESVSALKHFTAETCGDLSRFFQRTVEPDSSEYKTMQLEADYWYRKAFDNSHSSGCGRLFHHLAVVQSKIPSKLYYYAQSAAGIHPYASSEEGMMSVFKNFLSKRSDGGHDLINAKEDPDMDELFILMHAFLYIRSRRKALTAKGYRFDCIVEEPSYIRFTETKTRWLCCLNQRLRYAESDWICEGVETVLTWIAAWFNYDDQTNALHQYFRIRSERRKSTAAPKKSEENRVDTLLMSELFKDNRPILIARVTRCVLDVIIHHANNDNVLPHVHIILAFLFSISRMLGIDRLMAIVLRQALVEFLNTLIETGKDHGLDITAVAKQPLFPSAIDNGQPDFQKQVLPEDCVLAGLVWAGEYLPPNWVLRKPDMKGCEENASTWLERARRILKLGMELAGQTNLMDFDEKTERFSEDKSGCTLEGSVLVLEA